MALNRQRSECTKPASVSTWGSYYVTANNLVAQFEEAGIVTEITGGRRRRVFRYDGYLDLLSDKPRDTAAASR